MELVEGQTLAGVLIEGRLPLRTVTDIAVQIATGLARAHAAGIVHRDLKPQNVMVRNDGLVKILDFGLGTLTAIVQDGVSTMSPEASLTGAGVILGTVHLHVPGAGGRASGRLPKRSILVGIDALRDDRGPPSVRSPHGRADTLRDHRSQPDLRCPKQPGEPGDATRGPQS